MSLAYLVPHRFADMVRGTGIRGRCVGQRLVDASSSLFRRRRGSQDQPQS